jgi:hypothetical protein
MATAVSDDKSVVDTKSNSSTNLSNSSTNLSQNRAIHGLTLVLRQLSDEWHFSITSYRCACFYPEDDTPLDQVEFIMHEHDNDLPFALLVKETKFLSQQYPRISHIVMISYRSFLWPITWYSNWTFRQDWGNYHKERVGNMDWIIHPHFEDYHKSNVEILAYRTSCNDRLVEPEKPKTDKERKLDAICTFIRHEHGDQACIQFLLKLLQQEDNDNNTGQS